MPFDRRFGLTAHLPSRLLLSTTRPRALTCGSKCISRSGYETRGDRLAFGQEHRRGIEERDRFCQRLFRAPRFDRKRFRLRFTSAATGVEVDDLVAHRVTFDA
jgi:hypothetical protein